MKFTAAFCILATGASAFGLQTPAKAAARAAAKAPFLPAKQANKVPMVQPIDIDGVSCMSITVDSTTDTAGVCVCVRHIVLE